MRLLLGEWTLSVGLSFDPALLQPFSNFQAHPDLPSPVCMATRFNGTDHLWSRNGAQISPYYQLPDHDGNCPQPFFKYRNGRSGAGVRWRGSGGHYYYQAGSRRLHPGVDQVPDFRLSSLSPSVHQSHLTVNFLCCISLDLPGNSTARFGQQHQP